MTATPVLNGMTPETTGFPDYVDVLMSGTSWSFSGSRVITYSIQDDQYDALDGPNNQNDWQQWEIEAVHQAFAWIEAVIDVEFQYVGLNSGTANFDLHNYNAWWDQWPTPDTLAMAYLPNPNYPEAGDSYYKRQGWDEGSIQVGGQGFQTLVHELLHSLGLQHPFADDHGDGIWPSFDSLGTPLRDDKIYTTMSYTTGNWDPTNFSMPNGSDYGQIAGPMAFDIAALQILYGANTSVGAGNTVYNLPDTNVAGTYYESIWDVGGTDTISAEGSWAAAYINLQPGEFISQLYGVYGGFTIAYDLPDAYRNAHLVDAWIENATGGFGDDGIVGNLKANVLSGDAGHDEISGYEGSDTLLGGTGNDVLRGGEGDDYAQGGADNDIIDGDEGADTLQGDAGNDTIDGGAGDDIIDGGTGADSLFGGEDDDHILGGDGDDKAYGQQGDDRMLGDAGDDTLVGGTGADTLLGGDGNDNLQGDGADSDRGVALGDLVGGSDSIYGGAGNDAILGGAGDDFLDGGADDDVILGGAGNDTIFGGSEDQDFLSGGEGDDLIDGGSGDDDIMGDAGNDTLIGGDGMDTLAGGEGDDTYHYYGHEEIVEEGASSSDRVLLWAGIAAGIAGVEIYEIQEYAGALVATGNDDTNDTITGNEDNNGLYGMGGNDTLYGGWGNDHLDGDAGADFMDGGEGDDTYVFDGHDVIIDTGSSWWGYGDTVQTWVDVLAMLAGIEHLTALGSGGITLTGDENANNLVGNGGANTIHGRDGNDTIEGHGGNDLLYGDGGNDTIHGDDGDDTIVGGEDDLSDGNDLLNGGAGEDEIRGAAGHDILYGGEDNDVLYGGSGYDSLYGEGGNDSLYGGADSDNMEGGAGNDTLDGGGGGDYLYGGSGDDLVITSGGQAEGGEGVDRIVIDLSMAAGDVTGTSFDDTWTIRAPDAGEVTYTGFEKVEITTGSGHDWIWSGATDDTIRAGAGNDTIDSGTGADDIDGGDGIDEWYADMSGATGAVVIDLTGASSSLPGGGTVRNIEAIDIRTGSGNDVITTLVGNHRDWVDAGAGDDTIFLGGGNDNVDGGDGYDTVTIDLGHLTGAIEINGGSIRMPDAPDGSQVFTSLSNVERLTVLGGSGNDLMEGGNWDVTVDEEFHGNGGDDSLIGWKGSDTLVGGAGNDTMNGGLGNDVLDGGEGHDTAVFDGYRDNFTFTQNGDGSLTAVDTMWSEGTDILSGIESFRFYDGTFTFAEIFSPPDPNLDKTDPEIFSLDLPDTVGVGGGNAQATFTAGAADNKSGVQSVTLTFDKAITFVNGAGQTEVSNTVTVGGWSVASEASVSRTVSALTQAGVYSLVGASVVDHAGNTRAYTALELQGRGMETSLTVTADVQQPPPPPPPPVNHVPTGISLSGAWVAENSGAGTLVATLTGTDPDGDALSFSLLDNAGGRFALQGNRLMVANGALLDFETATAHAVTVRASDGRGGTFDKAFTVSVADVFDPAPLVTTTGSYTLPANVLNLKAGGKANVRLTGNALDNVITGNAGKNAIQAGSGNDVVKGGLGNDTLYGQAGKDAFVFDSKPNKSTNVDAIKDFNVKDDSIWLENRIFSKLTKKGTEASPFKLDKKVFWTGDKAHDKDDRVIYDKKSGALYYDADGTGSGAQVKIATLSKNLKMTYADFFVV